MRRYLRNVWLAVIGRPAYEPLPVARLREREPIRPLKIRLDLDTTDAHAKIASLRDEMDAVIALKEKCRLTPGDVA